MMPCTATARRVALAVLVLLGAASSSGRAFAQEPTGRVQLGPLSLAPTLAISGIGLDSNVFNDDGERKRDFTSTFSPQVDAILRLGRARLSGSSRLNVRYYKQYSDQGGTSTSNDLRLDVESARFSPYAAVGYQNTYDRASLEIDTRAHHRVYTTRAGTVARLSGKLSFDLAGERTGTSFEAGEQFNGLSLRDQLNRTTTGFDAALRYEVTPLTRITVGVDRDVTSFELSPDRDSTAVRFTGGFEFKPLALINGAARIGVLRYQPVGGEAVFLGPIAAVELGYTLLGATRFTFRVDRELGYSVDNLQTYYLQSGVALLVARQLDEHWDVGGNVGKQKLGTRSTVIGTTPPNPAGLIGPQDVFQSGGTVGYRVSRRLRFGVNADFTRRSGVPREEYGNLRIFGTLVYGIF